MATIWQEYERRKSALPLMSDAEYREAIRLILRDMGL